MPKFTRKTFEVEAYQLAGGPEIYNVVINWMVEKGMPRLDADGVPPPPTSKRSGRNRVGVYVDTHMGELVVRNGITSMRACHNDWIVYYPPDELLDGRFTVMKPNAFELLYQPV